MITITKVSNGYIINTDMEDKKIYKDNEIEQMFNYILQHLTGKCPSFRNEMFGEVRVNFDYALRK